MDGLHRRAGEFELPARFERDRSSAGDIEHADDVVALHDRLPAEEVLHALQERLDAALPAVWHRQVAGAGEREFLVFGTDPELFARFCPFREPGDEFVTRFHGRHVDLVTGHARSGRKRPRP